MLLWPGRYLYLQDKDFHLIHVPGKEVHQYVPDALSRYVPWHLPRMIFLAAMEPTLYIPHVIIRANATMACKCVRTDSKLKISISRIGWLRSSFVNVPVAKKWTVCVFRYERRRSLVRPIIRLKFYILTILVHSRPMIRGSRIYSSSLVLTRHHIGGLSFSPQRVSVHMRLLSFCSNILADSALLRQYTRIEGLISTTSWSLLVGTVHSLFTAYLKEENGIVERANEEVLQHLTVILFDKRISHAWSYEQLPMVEKSSTYHEHRGKVFDGCLTRQTYSEQFYSPHVWYFNPAIN